MVGWLARPMVPKAPPGWAALLTCLCATLALELLAPAHAEAWTRTEVSAMRARAEIARSGWARVSLELRVEVRGGWVERFELAGLHPFAKVDAGKPPTWIGEDGRKYAPSVALRTDDKSNGTLVLSFGDRAQAPHRGSYRAFVSYETELTTGRMQGLVAPDAKALALPAWPAALENVELWIDAPTGTRWLEDNGPGHAERVVLERGALSVLHVRRAQLPRTEALEVALVLPSTGAASVETSRRAARSPGLPAQAPAAHTNTRSAGVALLMLLALLALKLVLTAAARPARIAPARTAPARTESRRSAPLAHATFHAAARIDLQRARRTAFLRLWGPASALDATTPLGCALLISSGSLAALVATQAIDAAPLEPFIALWLLAAPLWAVRTRRTRTPGADDALLALLQARPSVAAVARQLGARAILEVTRDAPCAPARSVRLRIATVEHPDALSLVLTHDRAGRETLAWQVSNHKLIATAHPEAELPEMLTPAMETAHPLATAA